MKVLVYRHDLDSFFNKITLLLLFLQMSIQMTPLYEFSSEIVQLSQFKEQLLVSTLDKPVILDIKTGQTTQVITMTLKS